MTEYIEKIIVPYVESMRDEEDRPALVIMDNFKGQVTPKINAMLEANSIHVVLLPANATDRLQPMDISVNKPAKDYLRKEFQNWYSEKLMEDVEDDNSDIADINPINLGMPTLKELGAKWLVQMSQYISDNP